MTTMRAKFRVNTITYFGDPENTNSIKEYGMTAVYDGRTMENLRFAKATPFGEMKIRVDNPNAAPLTIGEEYYLDITPCYQAEALAPKADEQAMHVGQHRDPVDATRETDTDRVSTAGATTYTREAGYLGTDAPDTSRGYQTASGQDTADVTPEAPTGRPIQDRPQA